MNPDFQKIGEAFVEHYYKMYDSGMKDALLSLYHDTSLLTFEGDQKQGNVSIVEKHKLITSKTAHAVTTIDCQPMLNGSVLVNVLGQLKSDDDKPLPFTQTFVLSPSPEGGFLIMNETFRLALHNF
ncbi:probable nuclear transport factor 2 [Mya arenaria]|uniref:probable nuclear transport factor 2 n=1 Tax=Mya arenaria TaxID=6604 RepID=UPI0022E82B7E|nr:probable nuclear transport factor 2 [Mya arenaria]